MENNKKNELVKHVVITDKLVGEIAEFNYNGVECKSDEEKKLALKRHYQIAVAKKYGITVSDENNQPVKSVLIIGGHIVRVKIPAFLADEDGAATENLEEYYERTKKLAAANYRTIFKGLQKIQFLPEMI